jgi:cell division protein FtsW
MTSRRDAEIPDWIRSPAERRAVDRRSPERRSTARPAPPARRDSARAATERRATASRRAKPRRQARAAPGVAESRTLIFATIALLLYGLVMSYSASSAQAYFDHKSSFYFLERQAVYAVIGVIAMLALARIDYVIWRRLAAPIGAVVLGALVVVLVPGIGTQLNGARRWIFITGQSFTPSEFAKLAAVMVVAALIVRHPRDVLTGKGLTRLALVGIVPAGMLIMLEPDLGTTIILVAGVLSVLVAAGARRKHLLSLSAVGFALAGLLVLVEPYRMARLMAFLHPWRDAQGTGYQTTQSLISIASGHIFGVGLGNSVQKFGFLPEQGTDMITGIIGEELGLIGLLVLIGIYVYLGWACFRIALTCREPYGKLLATGITSLLVGQACINFGAALGVLPLTGVPLPLVSLGGTSMVVVLAGMGILLNIATNRRSYIVVSPERSDRSARRGGDRRTPRAGARGRAGAAR